MANQFHTGGINTPHEWNLYVLDNAARFYFWNVFLNGMASNQFPEDSYHAPENDQYANGCFPLLG